MTRDEHIDISMTSDENTFFCHGIRQQKRTNDNLNDIRRNNEKEHQRKAQKPASLGFLCFLMQSVGYPMRGATGL